MHAANNITLVRLAMVALIMISQLCFILWGEGAEPLEPATGLTLWKHAFIPLFGLSGYCVMASWDKNPDALRYSIARAIRMMPAIWAALLLAIVMGIFLTQGTLKEYLQPAALLGFLVRGGVFMEGKVTLPNVFGEPAPNNLVFMPLWTLKYLVLCYGAVLVMGLLGLTRKHWPYLAGLAVIVVLILAEMLKPDLYNPDSIIAHALRFCSSFFIGMVIWRYRHAELFNPFIVGGAAILLAMALAFGGLSQEFYVVLEVYLVLWIALRLPAVTALAGLPDLTLGLCLYGWPVTQALRVELPDWGFGALVLPVFILSLMLALLSYVLIEKPAQAFQPVITNRLKQRLGYGRK